MSFTFLDHTADIKFKARGKTRAALFEECAGALKEIIADKQTIKCSLKKTFTTTGNDDQALLYQFLEEILFLLDAEQFLVAKTRITFKGKTLSAVAWGDRASKYTGLNHIKAPTFAEMYVKKVKTGWEAQVVMDV